VRLLHSALLGARPVGIPVAHAATVSIAVTVPIAVARATVARATIARATIARTTVTTAGALASLAAVLGGGDGRQLLRGLALDLGIGGES
jgi:hypothetical protein